MDTLEYDEYTIEIDYDQSESPREWGTLGTIHTRSKNWDESEMSVEEFQEWRSKNNHNLFILPLYVYQHGCTLMSAQSFIGRAHHADWDSGQAGYVYTTRENVREWFGCKRISKKLEDLVYRVMTSEIETYSHYLNGDVYFFTIKRDEEIIDSCGSYFGYEAAVQAAKEYIAYLAKEKK